MNRYATGVAAVVAALMLGGCASSPTEPAPTAAAPSPATPAESAVSNTIPWGEAHTVEVEGEPVWTITVGQPSDQTDRVVADDAYVGWEEDYPSPDYVHYVTDVTVTRDAATPASPGDEITLTLIVDGIEEGNSPITLGDGPRWAFLDVMHQGATVTYPLVFSVDPGTVSGVAVHVTGAEAVYYG